jgi:hypothetical protein
MANEWVDRAKDFIKGHPEQAESALEKGEQAIGERTGGRYTEELDKGADLLRGQLGLPDSGHRGGQDAGPRGESVPNPSPATNDPQETQGGEGPLTPGEPLPQGGPTQQGSPQPTPTPGGTQPDTGGVAQIPTDETGGDAQLPGSRDPAPGTDELPGDTRPDKELPPFGRT